MNMTSAASTVSRRDVLRRGGAFLLGSTIFGPGALSRSSASADSPESMPTTGNDAVQARRRQMSQAVAERVALDGGLHVFLAHGVGNITAMATSEGLLLVDAGAALPPAAERLQTALSALSRRPLRYLVNTHWHFDHTDGNAGLRRLGAEIVAHRNVRRRLASPKSVAFFDFQFGPSPEDALPTATFDQELELYLGGEPVHLRHISAAHTDGDVFAHWPRANVIATGDLFFANTFPFIDKENGGRIEGMIQATELLLSLADANTRIVPGHGRVVGRKELRATLDMLRTCRDRIDRLHARGLTPDEAVAAQPLADFDVSWGQGFVNTDRFVRLVHSLTANP